MDFQLDEQQKMLKAMCRDFCKNEILPNREEWNKAHRFPVEMFQRMGQLGLCGLLVPEKYGGTDMGTVAYVAAMEEIAKADQSLAAGWNAHISIVSLPILDFGTEEQKQKWLVPLARGEKIGAFGLTEQGGGSDAAAIKTTAVHHGDDWVINGSKCFITNAGTSISLGVVALTVSGTDPSGKRRYSAIMIPTGTPGYTMGNAFRKIGWYGADTRELFFQDVHVPYTNLIGQEGAGLRQFLAVLDAGRISVAALALGLCWACLEAALDYAKQRVAFGQTISKFQAIQFKLADMALETELGRLVTYEAASLRDAHLPYSKEASFAKLYTSEAAMRLSRECIHIHGGYGIMEDYAVSRFLGDAKILEIGEGTSEIERLVIARHLGC